MAVAEAATPVTVTTVESGKVSVLRMAAAWYSTAEFTLSGNGRFELVNFIDGERTVTQIRDALAAEYGPVSIAEVSHYLDDLAKAGVIEWR